MDLVPQQLLKTPYLVFVGDTQHPTLAKTALGLVQWRREACLGQLRLTTSAVDLGLPDVSIAEAARSGAGSLVIGVAPVGGALPEPWTRTLVDASRAGLDVVAGLHTRLADVPGLADAARESGARLIDVRRPPPGLPVATGRKRSGLRLLTVGTDCAAGKKYTALAIERELRARGLAADFRATGQTGILIAGSGLPIDAVVADFVAGAAEVLSPDNAPDHWDVVEGQGAIFHPAYAGVTLGLLHGTQPDAIVLCHQAGLQAVKFWPQFPIRPLSECLAFYLAAGRVTNPAIRCVGISLDTSSLDRARADALLRECEREHGVPCVDPIATGVGPIVDVLQREFPAAGRGPAHRSEA